MNRRRICFLIAMLSVIVAGGQTMAHPGGVTTPSPDLPPDGVYLSPFDVHATYGGAALQIVLSAVQHQPFALLNPNDFQCGSGVPGGDCEHHEFDSRLEADFEVLMNGNPVNSGQIQMQGPVHTNAYGKGPSNPTGVFPTEMVFMHLTSTTPGPMGPPIMVREMDGTNNPNQMSTGVTDILPLGGGMYHIDSFFDVFTELSLDGGTTWIPSNGPTHVTLYVPEPASFMLVALGLMSVSGLIGRRR
jgi:hypothetical protein